MKKNKDIEIINNIDSILALQLLWIKFKIGEKPSMSLYVKILRADRPYEGMNIKGVKELTTAQRVTLCALGAIANEV